MTNSLKKKLRSDRPGPPVKAARPSENFFVRSWQNHWDVFLVIFAITFIFSFFPLGTAFQFGGDEGYELMKALLCCKGFSLYTQIWDDQPPLYTFILKEAFQLAGPTILVGRLVAAAFGLLLFAAFYLLIRQRSGRATGGFATFFLIASPGVLLLSVSVMQEVAMFGTALFSVWLLSHYRKNPRKKWLIASGIAMGIAAELKLSALLFVGPAALIEIALASRQENSATSLRGFRRNAFIWSAATLSVLTVVTLIWARGSFEELWRSHFTAQPVPGLGNSKDLHFPFFFVRDHIECVLAALFAIILAAQTGRLWELTVPVTLLLTAALVHMFYRPWWNYYYLHFAIPLAWLTGWAVNDLVRRVLQHFAKRRFHFTTTAWARLGLCALAAIAVARSERRLEGVLADITRHLRADANPIVQQMKKYRGRTNWVYTEDPIYAFHAQLLMPPELAVVTPKRFWSGQITSEQIIEQCIKYKAQLLVFSLANTNDSRWDKLLNHSYQREFQDESYTLYVSTVPR
jgi:hypothetical protein